MSKQKFGSAVVLEEREKSLYWDGFDCSFIEDRIAHNFHKLYGDEFRAGLDQVISENYRKDAGKRHIVINHGLHSGYITVSKNHKYLIDPIKQYLTPWLMRMSGYIEAQRAIAKERLI